MKGVIIYIWLAQTENGFSLLRSIVTTFSIVRQKAGFLQRPLRGAEYFRASFACHMYIIIVIIFNVIFSWGLAAHEGDEKEQKKIKVAYDKQKAEDEKKFNEQREKDMTKLHQLTEQAQKVWHLSNLYASARIPMIHLTYHAVFNSKNFANPFSHNWHTSQLFTIRNFNQSQLEWHIKEDFLLTIGIPFEGGIPH